MIRSARIALLTLLLSSQIATGNMSRRDTCDELLANEWLSSIVIQSMNQINNFPGQHALASQQIMWQLMLHFQNPNLDFAYFERHFRAFGGSLYLVANSEPLDPHLALFYPKGIDKLKGFQAPKYRLWVGVNGKEEADAFKAHLGISDEENLRRLRETGWEMIVDEEKARQDPTVDMADNQLSENLRKTGVQRPFDPRDN